MGTAKTLGKTAFQLAAIVVAAIVGFSLIYNKPIRFRPKWNTAPLSQKPHYSAGTRPDHLILSPAATPYGVNVNWRCSEEVRDGVVQYRPYYSLDDAFVDVPAAVTPVTAPELTYDRTVHCFSAEMPVDPRTRYVYRVGSPETGEWSDYHEFTSGAAKDGFFSFIAFGDTQYKLHRFGGFLRQTELRHPETDFYLVAGDMVEMGELRNQWDEYLYHTGSIFARKPFAPVLGNHDYHPIARRGLEISSGYFNPPDNGGGSFPKGVNYHFSYGNVLFIVLDTNMPAREQAPWFEQTLAMSREKGYDFTIAVFHIPMHHTRKGRSTPVLHEEWLPLIDAYGVDLVINGHEHNYLRTGRMRGDRLAGEDESGTVYVIACSCEKLREYVALPFAERQLWDVVTYQKIDVGRGADGRACLRYAAYTREGELVDSFELVKSVDY